MVEKEYALNVRKIDGGFLYQVDCFETLDEAFECGKKTLLNPGEEFVVVEILYDENEEEISATSVEGGKYGEYLIPRKPFKFERPVPRFESFITEKVRYFHTKLYRIYLPAQSAPNTNVAILRNDSTEPIFVYSDEEMIKTIIDLEKRGGELHFSYWPGEWNYLFGD